MSRARLGKFSWLRWSDAVVAGTEIEAMFVKPGATRNVGIKGFYGGGKGTALTAISGIVQRLKKWTTTASSGGTAITPSPGDPGMQASKCTAGHASAGVTQGTGGPTLLAAFVSGAAGPGGWVASDPDSVKVLEAAATMSFGFFNSSNTASMKCELWAEVIE